MKSQKRSKRQDLGARSKMMIEDLVKMQQLKLLQQKQKLQEKKVFLRFMAKSIKRKIRKQRKKLV